MPLLQLQPETQYVPTGMYDITQFPANSFVVKYIDPVSGNVGKAAVMSTVSGGTTTYSILIGSTQYQLVGYNTKYANYYYLGNSLGSLDFKQQIDTTSYLDSLGNKQNFVIYKGPTINTSCQTYQKNPTATIFPKYIPLWPDLVASVSINGLTCDTTNYYNTLQAAGGNINIGMNKLSGGQMESLVNTWYNTTISGTNTLGTAWTLASNVNRYLQTLGLAYSTNGQYTMQTNISTLTQVGTPSIPQAPNTNTRDWALGTSTRFSVFDIWKTPQYLTCLSTTVNPIATYTPPTFTSIVSPNANAFYNLLINNEPVTFAYPLGLRRYYYYDGSNAVVWAAGPPTRQDSTAILAPPVTIASYNNNGSFNTNPSPLSSLNPFPAAQITFVSSLGMRMVRVISVLDTIRMNGGLFANSTQNPPGSPLFVSQYQGPLAVGNQQVFGPCVCIVDEPYTGQFLMQCDYDPSLGQIRVDLVVSHAGFSQPSYSVNAESMYGLYVIKQSSLIYTPIDMSLLDLSWLAKIGLTPIIPPDATTIVAIANAQSAISTSITTVTTAQTSINTAVTSITAAIAAANTAAAPAPQDPTISNAVSTINSQLPTVQGYITSLQTALTTLQAQNTAAQSTNTLAAFTAVQTSASALATTATNNANSATTAVSTANTQVATIKQTVTSINTADQSIQNSITSVNASLTSMQASLNAATSSVQSVQNYATLVAPLNDPNVNNIISTANAQPALIQSNITSLQTSLQSLQSNYTQIQTVKTLPNYQNAQSTAGNLASTGSQNATAAAAAASSASAQVAALQQAAIAATTTVQVTQFQAQAGMYLAQANGYNDEITLDIAYITIYQLDIQLLLAQMQAYSSQAQNEIKQITALLNDIKNTQIINAQTAQAQALTAYNTAQSAINTSNQNPSSLPAAQTAASTTKTQLSAVQAQKNTSTQCQTNAQQDYQNALQIYQTLTANIAGTITPGIDTNITQIINNITIIQQNITQMAQYITAAQNSASNVTGYQDTTNVTAAANAAEQAAQNGQAVQNALQTLQTEVTTFQSNYNTAKANSDVSTLNTLANSLNTIISDTTAVVNLAKTNLADTANQATAASTAATAASGVQDGSINQLVNNAITQGSQCDALASTTAAALQQVTNGLATTNAAQATIQLYDPNAPELATIATIITSIQAAIPTVQQAQTAAQAAAQANDVAVQTISTGSPTLTQVQTASNTITQQLTAVTTASNQATTAASTVNQQVAQAKLLASTVISRTVDRVFKPIQASMDSINKSIGGIQSSLQLAQNASDSAQKNLNAVKIPVGQDVLGPIQVIASNLSNNTTTISSLLQQTTSQASALQTLIATAENVFDLAQLTALTPAITALQTTATKNLASANTIATDAQTQAGIVASETTVPHLIGSFFWHIGQRIGGFFTGIWNSITSIFRR